MKRFLTLLLALSMILALAAPALADDTATVQPSAPASATTVNPTQNQADQSALASRLAALRAQFQSLREQEKALREEMKTLLKDRQQGRRGARELKGARKGLVALQNLANALQATITYDPKAGTLTFVRDDKTLVYRLGETTATLNGQEVQLPTAGGKEGREVKGVPIRAIAELLGALPSRESRPASDAAPSTATGAAAAQPVATPSQE